MEYSGYVYICAGGETFDSIALTKYHSEKYAADLLCMNPEHCRKTIFTGGEVLLLPVVDVPENDLGVEPDYSLPTVAPWKE